MKWSKNIKTAALITAILLAALLFFFGCKGASPGSDVSADLSTVITLSTVSYDFGMIEAEADSENLIVEITNDSSEEVILSQILLSDPVNFSHDDSGLPLTLAPGDSASITSTFHPMESGSLETIMEISAEGFDTPIEATLNGKGNYPPIIAPGLMVYDADPTIAGFYCLEGELNGKELFRSNEYPQYLLFFHDSSNKWVVDDDITIEYEYYAERFQDSKDKQTYLSPDQVNIWNKTSTDVCDNVSGPVISGADLSDVSPKVTTVRVYYFFCDTEDDSEDSSLFTWYRCTSMEDPGTILSGITGREYTIQGDDLGCCLRVEMIPCASSGIQDGYCTAGPVSRLIEIGDLPPE